MLEDLLADDVFSRPYTSLIDIGCGTGILGIFAAKHMPCIQNLTFTDWLLSPLLFSRINCENTIGTKFPQLDTHFFLGPCDQWMNEDSARLPYNVALCNPPYLPILEGFGKLGLSTTVAGSDLLVHVIKKGKDLANQIYISFSELVMPEALAAVATLPPQHAKSFRPIGPSRLLPFRSSYAFEIPGYVDALIKQRGLLFKCDSPYPFWHKVTTFALGPFDDGCP
jgi:hypothetical protein